MITRQYRSELVEAYEDSGTRAADALDRWLGNAVPLVQRTLVEDFAQNAPIDLLHDSFWRQLPFGTGGIRGAVGVGPNRINHTTVALTVQAHCEVLVEMLANGELKGREKSVIVANDIRKFLDQNRSLAFLTNNSLVASEPGRGVSSRSLSHLAATIYAANGFTVHMVDPGNDADDQFLTTPELSFLIRNLSSCAGINVSASHNPRDDNGVKLYDHLGGQYLPPHDEQLSDRALDVEFVKLISLAEALEAGLVRPLDSAVLDSYLTYFLDRAQSRGLKSSSSTKVLLTPLAGCGERTLGRVLPALGYEVQVAPEERPDPTFARIPLHAPNPEVEQATRRSKEYADDFGALLVIASDPDADRLGVEVKHGGAWVHLTGNQIATVLAYRLLLDPEGPRLRGGVYETVVTTLAVSSIARRAQCSHVVDDLLVGFKYIGSAIRDRELALSGMGSLSEETLISFAAEESHGYLDHPQARDKDAVSGAIYIVKLHEELLDRGQTVIDYLNEVYVEVGKFGDRGRSILLRGSTGVREIATTMAAVRSAPPRTLGNVSFDRYQDFQDQTYGPIKSRTDLQARDVVVLHFVGGRVTLRPSGTEPKLKLYVQTTEDGGENPQRLADDLASEMYDYLVELLGLELAAPWAQLPDVVPLDVKVELQNVVVPELWRRVEAGEEGSTLQQWLMLEAGARIEGGGVGDVLPAIRASLEGNPDAHHILAALENLPVALDSNSAG